MNMFRQVDRNHVAETLIIARNAVDGQSHATALIIALLILIIRIMVYGMEKQDGA